MMEPESPDFNDYTNPGGLSGNQEGEHFDLPQFTQGEGSNT